jgi:hypothetical protein
MNTNGIPSDLSAQSRSVLLRSSLALFIFVFCPISHPPLSGLGDRGTHVVQAQPAEHSQELANSVSTRVAQGEYKVLGHSGIGSFDPAVYDFTESWTLSRLADGTFEVEGTRSYRSPADDAHSDNFHARLSSTLEVTELKEFRPLRWRPRSGPLTCDFLPVKVKCNADSRDKTDNLSLDIPVEAAAGLMWPISAFSLSSITRSASRDPKTTTPVELLTFEELSYVDPLFTTILTGQLKYLGHEKVHLAGHEWLADKFELKVATQAPFLLWVSSQGLLLASAYKSESNKLPEDDGMVLVSFRVWQEF